MAITLDQLLGSQYSTGNGTSCSFTTSQAVASDGFIVVGVGWFDNLTLNSISGGGLTWAVDAALSGVGNQHAGIGSAQAPSGLASGTTITANFSGNAAERVIGGVSFTGVKTSAALDAADIGAQTGGSTAWSSDSVTIQDGSVLCACCYCAFFGGSNSSTITSPSQEVFDAGLADTAHGTMGYRIEATGGSFTVAGTWAQSSSSNVAAAAYLAAPAGADTGLAWITA